MENKSYIYIFQRRTLKHFTEVKLCYEEFYYVSDTVLRI